MAGLEGRSIHLNSLYPWLCKSWLNNRYPVEGYNVVWYREQVTHKEVLRKLGLFSLARRELRCDFIAAGKHLMGSYKMTEPNSSQ